MEGYGRQDIEGLERLVSSFNGQIGKELGSELYHLCSALMPSVNVDVLLRSDDGIYLRWRDDDFYGPGWHVPGGVVRHKETLLWRVTKVLEHECGVKVAGLSEREADSVRELFHSSRCIRGHFISIAYVMRLDDLISGGGVVDELIYGKGKFFDVMPPDLIIQHQRAYGHYFA